MKVVKEIPSSLITVADLIDKLAKGSGILVTVYGKKISLVVPHTRHTNDVQTYKDRQWVAGYHMNGPFSQHSYHTASESLDEFIKRHLDDNLEQELHFFENPQALAQAILHNDWE